LGQHLKFVPARRQCRISRLRPIRLHPLIFQSEKAVAETVARLVQEAQAGEVDLNRVLTIRNAAIFPVVQELLPQPE